MNFKNVLLTSCVAICVQASGFAQQNFEYEISGKITGADKILLAGDPYGGVILDSASNADGSFVFRGKAKNISLGSIIVESKKLMFERNFNVFIEPGKIKVKPCESGGQLEVRGSLNNNIMTNVESQNKIFWDKVTKMYDTLNYASMQMQHFRKEEIVNKDSVAYYQAIHDRIEKESEPYIIARIGKLKDAFRKYPKSYFTAYIALNSIGFTEDELKKIYEGFDETIKNSAIGKNWQERLFAVTQLEEGSVAPDFAVPDVNGKEVKLSSMRGKYVLLDFWATWCGPCRAGNPHLISLYNQYKKEGLEIIGIADDDNNIAGWKKAIKDDGIEIWPQVLRNKNKLNASCESIDLSGTYKVGGYPTKILIDKEGKIVHQFTDDNELDAKLIELFRKG